MIGEVVEKVKETIGFDPNKRKGANPHATFEQGRPAVNKDEPSSFANPIEAGAKKFSEEACGKPMPATFDIQPGADFACPTDAHTRMGSDPHAMFEQCQPAVNKVEPSSFANPCEAGAKKPSEAQFGKPMPDPGKMTSCQ
jgi:hypothetical protein